MRSSRRSSPQVCMHGSSARSNGSVKGTPDLLVVSTRLAILPARDGRTCWPHPLRARRIEAIHQAGYAYDGAIRRRRHVLVVDRRNQATELYDLATDPAQARNLIDAPAHAALIAELRAPFLKHNDHDDATREPRTTRAFKASRRTSLPR